MNLASQNADTSCPITNGLLAAYEFSDNADDSSFNGNAGLVNGGVTFTADRFGNADSALNFDGRAGADQ